MKFGSWYPNAVMLVVVFVSVGKLLVLAVMVTAKIPIPVYVPENSLMQCINKKNLWKWGHNY